MSPKNIRYGSEARALMGAGVNTLADAAQVTLGPRGREVLIAKSYGAPHVTKDGVSVAKEIEIKERAANLGASMVREVAKKTSDTAGDGTTTAIVLARAIYREGVKLVAAGYNPMPIKRGLDKGVSAVVEALKHMARPVSGGKDIARVAAISANNDEFIGKLIAEAMEKVGKEGVITVEESKVMDTTLELVEGMQFDRGYISPYFATHAEKMEAVLEDAYVLLHEKKISHIQDLLPLLEKVARTGNALLIVSEDVQAEALATLIVNRLRGTLKVAAVKAPGFGDRRKEMLQDMAVLCGGRVVAEETGIKLATLDLADLGKCKTVRIDKDHTTLIQGGGQKADIEARIKQLRTQIAETKSDYDREKLQERQARLSSGVGVIKLGAATETEMKEKKPRVENALNATKAAVEEGIVPGGGVALLRCRDALDKLGVSGEEQEGIKVLKRALAEPLCRIAANAGHEPNIVLGKVLEKADDYGFNAETGNFGTLIKAGVIDPAKVVRLALQNAASVAGLMLTTEAVITEKPEKKKFAAPPPDYDEDFE